MGWGEAKTTTGTERLSESILADRIERGMATVGAVIDDPAEAFQEIQRLRRDRDGWKARALEAERMMGEQHT